MTARIAQLSKDRCAVFFDDPAEGINAKARLTVSVGGTQRCTPVMILRLPLEGAGLRFVALLTTNDVPVHRQEVKIQADGRLVARIDPDALQSPLVDHLSLLSSLSCKGQTKLLRALLTTGPSLFKSGLKVDKSLDGFDKIVQQLLSSLSVPCLPLQSLRALGKAARTLSYTLPDDAVPVEISDLVEVASGKVRRISKFDVLTQVDAGVVTLHLVLPKPLAPGATLIGVSDRPLHLAGPEQDQDLRPLQPWLQRQTPPVQRFMIGALKKRVGEDALADHLYQEVRCPEQDKPRLDILYAARCGDGLLYMIKAHDPRSLLSNARWVCDDTEFDVPLDRPVWHPVHGDVYPGYLRGFEPTDALPSNFQLWGEMRSRRAFLAETVAPGTFDGLVPEIYDDLDSAPVGAMLGQAVARAVQDRPVPRAAIDWFGTRPDKAKTALLIFVRDTFDHPRALLTQLAEEPGAEASMVFLVAANPGQRPGLRRLAADLHAVTSCPIAVLTLGAEALPAEKLRLALTQQLAEATLLFDGSCLPETAGWLDRWHALVSTAAQAQTASIPVHGGTYPDLSFGRCQIFNHTAVDLFKRRPLQSVSLAADLTELRGITDVAVAQTDGVRCYESGPVMSNAQIRADAEAAAYLARRAI